MKIRWDKRILPETSNLGRVLEIISTTHSCNCNEILSDTVQFGQNNSRVSLREEKKRLKIFATYLFFDVGSRTFKNEVNQGGIYKIK